jgi:hypothetical protein
LKKYRSELISIGIIILVLIALVGLTWANYVYALSNPGGNDFLSHWLGTRLFLMEGQSPYSEATSIAIQRFINEEQFANSVEDQVLFVYPFYSIYLFAPYSLIAEFDVARALMMTTMEISLILLVAASLSLARWKVGAIILAVLLIFALLWYHSVRPLVNGNVSILCALFIAASFLAIRAEQDGLAGFLLALSTIKPQMVILLVVFVLIWSASHQRWALVWSLLGSLALLIASTSLFIPNWIWQNLVQIFAYSSKITLSTPGTILVEWIPGVGKQLGWAITFLIAGFLVWEWRGAWGKDFHWFFWVACLTLVGTNFIGIPTSTVNYIALFPALILVLATLDRDWGLIGKILIGLSLVGLFFGLWWFFLITVNPVEQTTQQSVMFFPLPIYLLVTLYWVRWWVLRPKRPLLDQLRRI